MDWDTWFFEVWEQGENAGTTPTQQDYMDWLYDIADNALGSDV